MHTKESELVLINEIGQLPALERLLRERAADISLLTVVALDAEVDMHLREKKIPFLSARDYRTKGADYFVLPEKWLAMIEGSAWSWFGYRGISFGQLFFSTLQDYIRRAIYYTDIIVRVCAERPGLQKITVLAPTQGVPPAGAYIARRQIFAVVDSARLVGEQRGIDVAVYGETSGEARAQTRARLFSMQRALFGLGLALLNLCTNLLRSRKATVRLLVSDYWRNIAPVLQSLPEAEVILCDRKEVFNVGLRNAWRYRMRFMGLDAYPAHGRAGVRAEALRALEGEWEKARTRIPDTMRAGDLSLTPLFLDLVGEIVHEWLPMMLEKIDELYALVDTLHPDIVLLRATVSQQWHFPLLALIAKERGIPSLELLHGMEYPGPGSADKRHVAAYLGVYGLHTQRQLVQEGFKAESLPVIGSPRFDQYESEQYAQLRKGRTARAAHPPVIFCTAPDVFMGATFDTYDIEDYFSSVAKATKGIPGVSVIVKLRPGRLRETFYRQAIAKAFAGIPHTIAQFEPLRELFPKVDLAVSCQSTVTLEALQCGVPLVAFAATPVEALELAYNFTDLAEQGAAALCLDEASLVATLPKIARDEHARKGLSAAAEIFLDREFAFDGKGAARAATFIRALAKKGAGNF